MLFFSFISNGFNFSKNFLLKILQILIIIFSLTYIIFLIHLYLNINLIYLEGSDDIVKATIETSKDASIKGTISMSQDTFVKTTSSLTKTIGLGSAIGCLGAAVGTAFKNSPLPPIQKVGVVVVGGLMGGLFHSGISNINNISDSISQSIANSNNYNNSANNTSSDNSKSINSNDSFNPASPN